MMRCTKRERNVYMSTTDRASTGPADVAKKLNAALPKGKSINDTVIESYNLTGPR